MTTIQFFHNSKKIKSMDSTYTPKVNDMILVGTKPYKIRNMGFDSEIDTLYVHMDLDIDSMYLYVPTKRVI